MPPSEKPWPRTHHEVVQRYLDQHDDSIRAGVYEPLVYPWAAFGAFVVVLYLLVPHKNRPWIRRARFLVFLFFAGFQAYTVQYTRGRAAVVALGHGLITGWSVIWGMVILAVNDCQVDFQRIERMEGVFRGSLNEKDHKKVDEIESSNDCNGDTSNKHSEHLGPSKRHGEFAWQPYPLTPFSERLDWVLDIFSNFRGMGWNWRTSSMPPPPKTVQEQLRRNSSEIPPHSSRVHPGQPYTYSTRHELLIGNFKTLMMGYIMLDGLKTLMMHDRYFWGYTDWPTAPAYLPAFFDDPIILRMYRLTLSALGIQWALKAAFSLGPLFFSGVLGPSIIGARAEPWIYPETWGPYTTVFEKGLAGWWSGWWHQTFRFAFDQRKIVSLTGLDRFPPIAKFLQLVIAFALSGFLHAVGSYTSAGPTQPVKIMSFFLLQAIGIFAEAVITELLRKTGVQRYFPRRILNAFTFAYVHVWFYFTGPLLSDDFAKAGTWLFQPVPLSLFRGIGLGTEGDGWWCWGRMMSWHSGDRWWKSGIVL